MTKRQKTLFCFGAGYSAQCLSRRLMAEGWKVWGTSRRVAKRGLIPSLLFTGEARSLEIAERLQEATHILISIPPDAGGDRVLRHHREDILRAHEEGRLAWLGYFSTTGVYGERYGGRVSEGSAPQPQTARARARWKAERQWLGLFRNFGAPVHIFRLAGIYGPKRNVLETLRRQKARRLYKRRQMFSRIHVEDITQSLSASIASPHAGRIYNLSDNAAAPQSEVMRYGARLLGIPSPPLLPIEKAKGLSEMAKSFYSENRRVQNKRIQEELGVKLAYPTYREGLLALWDSLSKERRSTS